MSGPERGGKTKEDEEVGKEIGIYNPRNALLGEPGGKNSGTIEKDLKWRAPGRCREINYLCGRHVNSLPIW